MCESVVLDTVRTCGERHHMDGCAHSAGRGGPEVGTYSGDGGPKTV